MMNGQLTDEEFKVVLARVLLGDLRCRDCARLLPLAEHWRTACLESEQDGEGQPQRWCSRPLLVRPIPVGLHWTACCFFEDAE